MRDAMALMGAIAFVLLGYLVWLALFTDQSLLDMLVDVHTYLSTPIR